MSLSATGARRNARNPHRQLIRSLVRALRSARAANANLRAEVDALLADRACLLNELGAAQDRIDALRGEAVPL